MPLVNSSELRKLRKEKGYTQPAFAEKIGMKISTYAYKEKIGQFDEQELKKIFKELDISKFSIPVGESLAGDLDKKPSQMPDDTRELIASLKRENDLLRKQNETSLDDIWEALQVNQRMLTSLLDLARGSKNGKTLNGGKQEEKNKGSEASLDK